MYTTSVVCLGSGMWVGGNGMWCGGRWYVGISDMWGKGGQLYFGLV